MKNLPSPHRPKTLTAIPRADGVDYDVMDELIGYSLRRAQVAMFLAFHEATRGLDVTPPRFTALVLVGANPGITQSLLGEALGMARSNAKTLVDWMEARALAARRPREDDRRAWGLHLTAAGARLVARMKRRVLEEDRRRSARLGATRRRELLALLNELAD
jgi:DNA-binding MarR family transcriptional regulator